MGSIKHIEIFPYTAEWQKQFEDESNRIKNTLGDICHQVHHIGSTAVPGLSAKDTIDILCVVNDLSNSLVLQELGYVFKGELNIPLRYYFSKNTPTLKVNLHVVEPDHGFIHLNLCFRDYLRSNEKTRLDYEALKHRLIQDPINFERVNGGSPRYTLKKNDFIKSTLQAANFDGIAVNFCTHHREWETYHRIRTEQLFAPTGIIYDLNHPTLSANNHYHFVLYKGTIIVTVAQIEMLDNDVAVLRSIATDTPHQRQGHASYLLRFIEHWLHHLNIKAIKTHAELATEYFYRNHGYVDMLFDDISISNTIVNLEKTL
ncbi:MAG: GNAT family N-acetyltransferase [Alphaproteobacteria bacterium]|nr:GNAT family N-acetyltransferase [Alphaproteobacteria bacterium]